MKFFTYLRTALALAIQSKDSTLISYLKLQKRFTLQIRLLSWQTASKAGLQHCGNSLVYSIQAKYPSGTSAKLDPLVLDLKPLEEELAGLRRWKTYSVSQLPCLQKLLVGNLTPWNVPTLCVKLHRLSSWEVYDEVHSFAYQILLTRECATTKTDNGG